MFIGYTRGFTCSVLAPVYPVEIGDLERSANVVLTAQLEVALGGGFTEACEAQLGHSVTSCTQVSNND
jgi:hypothetical protein